VPFPAQKNTKTEQKKTKCKALQ